MRGNSAGGENCDAVLMTKAFKLGWRNFIVYKYRGQRFTGCGFGPATKGVRIDVYGSSGDYLASGIDGMEIYVHGNAQDQLCQIMKTVSSWSTAMSGKHSCTAPKAVWYLLWAMLPEGADQCRRQAARGHHGTALDYLAESFMAGDALNGGGFVVLNGIGFDDNDGSIRELESPYPGSNIFSLASGGAILCARPAPETGGRAIKWRSVRQNDRG